MGSQSMGDLGQTTKQHVPAEDGRQQAKREEEEEEEEKEEQKGETELVREEKERVSLITISEDPPNISIIPLEEFQKVLGSLCSAAAVTSQLRIHRDALVGKLESLLKIRKQSLHRIDELEVLKSRLRSKDLTLENAKVSLQEKSEDVAIAKDKLLPSARSLLAAANCLAVAHNHLQDACKHLEGEGGQGRLLHLQNMLRTRRRLMVSQIAALYPIVPCPVPVGKSLTPNTPFSQQRYLTNTVPQSSDSSNKDNQPVDKSDSLPMTIGGLHVVAPLNTRPGLYTEPNDHESSATALGYVAHSLALLAACLDVPLRYPIRLGASRSYIQDYAPIVEANEAAAANSVGPNSGGGRRSLIEFPLYSEGQDSTRSAYAVFLLNKDLEQVLNYMGAETVGPRHTLPNLNKIIKLVCSGACTTA
ncbi:hypothetical protein GOP47_0016803 [Adiantum capillus-veneris]|uniref:UV radiation resistance-associated gene protein n=1 Tax=Adiantum capillus-veneris TaxID=13818 RepID=A0A9D4UID7_ADICA|nr:hypothetical protein GOP47_0016803 [Adiantum capillus-veneris]